MKIQNKTILITGGAGFIGTALAQRLCKTNEVIIYDNLFRNSLKGSGLLTNKNVRLIRADILDAKKLQKATKGVEIVVHLAAIAGVDTVMRNPVDTMRVNMIGTYNLLEAASQNKKLLRFVNFSTSEVFGTIAYKVDELHATAQGHVGEARWIYAVSKLAGEHMAHAYQGQKGLPAVTLRPFNVYGPGQVGDGAIRSFMLNVLRGEDLIIRGDGSQIRAWCYIDDMIEGIMLALEKDAAVGNIFNIGNPRSTVTIYDLAGKIIKITGTKAKLKFAPLGYVDIELRIPNIDKAREILRFEPKVNLEEGLKLTFQWYKNNYRC